MRYPVAAHLVIVSLVFLLPIGVTRAEPVEGEWEYGSCGMNLDSKCVIPEVYKCDCLPD